MLKDGVAFLNHGSFGAVPRRVFEEQTNWRRRIEAEPIEFIARRCESLINHAKAVVGRQFGMQPDHFGFVTNATEGVNAVLRSLSLAAGDELLTTDHVYNAVRQTLKLVARGAGAVCREIPIPLPIASAEQIRDRVLSALSPRTRLLVIDHVTSPSGLVFPVEQIVGECRKRGVDVLVDGAHAPGMLPLDVAKIGANFYAANLHKWVCSPKGTAFLWVAPDQQAKIHPTVISHHLDEGFAREFGWQGTRDLSAWLTAPMAIEFLGELGWARMMSHNHAMATWAHQLLVRRLNVDPVSPLEDPASLLGSMATVPLPGNLAQLEAVQLLALQQRLYDEFALEQPMFRFQDRAMLRVSAHVYNEPWEYHKLAETIAKL
jgi:isopenicillin-N epimerase